MRIGFDAKRLFFNQTGLGVYSRLLLRGMSESFPENEYLLYARKPENSQYYGDFKDLQIKSGSGLFWRSHGIKKDILTDDCDLYHGLSHELPYGIREIVKKVVTIHDLIFIKDPSLYPFIDRKIYDLKWRHSCTTADKIIAVSNHTRKDIIEVYDTPEDKIEVIYPPVDTITPQSKDEEKIALKKYGLEDPYWLYVGSLNKRKNLIGLLEALTLARQKTRLIVVGSGSKYEQRARQYVKDNQLSKQVQFAGHIPNKELNTFYKNALALIYPSFYEGFGIPIVEALQNHTPVITSNTSSMPEAAGPGALLISPDSPESISEALDKLAEDSSLRNRLASEGHTYVKQFSPEIIARQTMELYESL